ncbi:MAG: Hsp70 family protein, partial [Chloroflexales bacterium]
MRVGLDFGTTNSSAAVYDGSRLTLLPLDPVSSSPSILRSTLFITREGAAYIGRAAINHFTEGNVGREVVYEWKYLGDAEMTFAELGTQQQALYVKVEVNAPGRLFRSLKTGLRDRSFRHTNVFGISYSLEELIAIVLRLIYERIEASIGQKVTGMVIGRPVHYAASREADALAFERMQAACRLAELPGVTFLDEPIGAALAYAREVRSAQHALVFDFGGGTLDVTIMRLDGRGRRQFIATDGVPVGGDLLDQRLVMGRLMPHFGEGATLGARRLPFPTHVLEHLSEWQTISDMTQPKYPFKGRFFFMPRPEAVAPT